MSEFESIHSVLKEVSQHHGLGLKLLEARLQQEWEELVGPTLAKHSYPSTIRYRNLNLISDNSVWLQQLVFLKPQILESIRTRFPELEVSDIHLRLGSLPQKFPLRVEGNDPVPPPVLPTPFARDLSKQFLSPDLQVLFSRTITRATSDSLKESPKLFLS